MPDSREQHTPAVNDEQSSKKTLKPLHESDPEWARVSYITTHFQVGPTVVFRKIRDGIWKSVLLRDRDKKSGIRLVYVPSVREHLSNLLSDNKS